MKALDLVEISNIQSRHRWEQVQGFYPESDELEAKPVGSELAEDLNFDRPFVPHDEGHPAV